MTHAARGAVSLAQSSSREAAPVAPSLTSDATLSGVAIVNDGGVPTSLQAPNHIGAHPTESDHPELHPKPPVACCSGAPSSRPSITPVSRFAQAS